MRGMIQAGEADVLIAVRSAIEVGIDQAHYIAIQDVSRWVAGLALCGHAASRLEAAVRNFHPIGWAKSQGMTWGMWLRYNVVTWSFFAMLITGGALNVVADIPSMKNFHTQYQAIPSILAMSSLCLLLYNYAQIVTRGLKQHKLEKIPQRLEFALRVTESRGIKLHELVLTPAVFLVPMPDALKAVRHMIAIQ